MGTLKINMNLPKISLTQNRHVLRDYCNMTYFVLDMTKTYFALGLS